MPPFPGEETLATVYADLHSYFTAPSARPALHRFDKACYFYVYHNSTRQTSRIEAAINAGTAEQTAFSGGLESVKVINSHRFASRVTLVVDGEHGSNTSPTARSARDPDEWRLASSDPRDPGPAKYRIHTIDLYFWNQDDSKQIVDLFKRMLQPDQLELDESEEEPHHQDMVSPVVQNLEHVAISDPVYKQGQHDRNTESPYQPHQARSSQTTTNPHAQTASVSPTSHSTSAGGRSSANPGTAANYTPLAYNPAAPAAPEPIAHREDTPPPIDAADGTGLAAATKHEHYPSHPHQPYGGPPAPQTGAYGQYGASPAPSFGPHATTSPVPSFGPQAIGSIPQAYGGRPAPTPSQYSHTSVSTSFAPPPTTASSDGSQHPSAAAQQYIPHGGQDPNSHIFGPSSVETPGTQFYSSINNGQPHKALQHVQPQYPDYLSAGQAPPPPPGVASPPVGGYSSYNYNQAPQGQHSGQQGGYDVHNQVYRPTEAEHSSHHHHSRPSKGSNSDERKPSASQRVEKGIGKWIKKVEKNFG